MFSKNARDIYYCPIKAISESHVRDAGNILYPDEMKTCYRVQQIKVFARILMCFIQVVHKKGFLSMFQISSIHGVLLQYILPNGTEDSAQYAKGHIER